MPEITWFDVITLIALVTGPVAAVIIAHKMDNHRVKRERRMDVFRTLMRTRRARLVPEHVGALNLVEIEFKDKPTVIAEWKAYFAHLAIEHPKRTEEQFAEDMKLEEKRKRRDKYDQRIGNEREKLLAKLLHAIAKVMEFEIEQLEIFEGGYLPQAWSTIELEQEAIRKFLVGLYFGDLKVPVAVTDYTAVSSGAPDNAKESDASTKSEN